MSGHSERIRGWAALAVMLISASAWGETIELLTYYPPPPVSGEDDHVRSLRVGDGYQTLPVPEDGVALIYDRMAIGVPTPASETITPLWALQVVGRPGRADRVLLEPGVGGRMELEVTGNVALFDFSPGGSVTLFAGSDPFIFDYGTENTYMGIRAGKATISPTSRNIGLGHQALSANTAYNNAAVGADAMSTTQGAEAVAVGANVLAATGNAHYDTAIGTNALTSSTGGFSRVALGANTLTNTTGYPNIAIGEGALAGHTVGSIVNWSAVDSNVAVGAQALASNTTGGKNSVIGFQAGKNNATGSGNLFLGYQAGMNETGSNLLYIANSDTAAPLIWGDLTGHVVRINGSLQITSVKPVSNPSWLKWGGSSAGPYQYQVGKDLAELFDSSAGRLPVGTIAALGANGSAVAAAAGSQTLGPTPALPGILMDGPSQRIGPTPEEVNVPGKTAVALLGRVSVQTQGPVQVGDILVAGPSGKAVRWSPDKSILSYAGLVLEADPKAQMATVLVGHQGLQKVLDSIQAKKRILRENLNELQEELERMERSGK